MGFTEETDSFLAEIALETHCFVLGGNKFRLRVIGLRREKEKTLLNLFFQINIVQARLYFNAQHRQFFRMC